MPSPAKAPAAVFVMIGTNELDFGRTDEGPQEESNNLTEYILARRVYCADSVTRATQSRPCNTAPRAAGCKHSCSLDQHMALPHAQRCPATWTCIGSVFKHPSEAAMGREDSSLSISSYASSGHVAEHAMLRNVLQPMLARHVASAGCSCECTCRWCVLTTEVLL